MYRDLISLQNSLWLDSQGPRIFAPFPFETQSRSPHNSVDPTTLHFRRAGPLIRCSVGPYSQQPDWQVHVPRSVKLPHRQKSRASGFLGQLQDQRPVEPLREK